MGNVWSAQQFIGRDFQKRKKARHKIREGVRVKQKEEVFEEEQNEALEKEHKEEALEKGKKDERRVRVVFVLNEALECLRNTRQSLSMHVCGGQG